MGSKRQAVLDVPVNVIVGLMGIVVHDLGKQPLVQGRAERLAKLPQGGGRGHDDKMLELAALFGAVKMRRKPRQKLRLALIVRINPGLNRMAGVAYRLVNPGQALRHQVPGGGMRVVEFAIGKLPHALLVGLVKQYPRLCPVGDNYPCAVLFYYRPQGCFDARQTAFFQSKGCGALTRINEIRGIRETARPFAKPTNGPYQAAVKAGIRVTG